MSRILKILGIVVGAVVLLLVIVLVAVAMLFDPNDYKDDITAAVARATGRTLTLDGDLGLAVFPSIEIDVGAASLSTAQGFGAAPMARIGSAELKLALLPLLTGRVEVGRARLDGLELNLERDAAGRNNWQDLGGGGGAAAAPAEGQSAPAGPGQLDLQIAALEIADARVTWSDASTGSRWELTNFGLEAEDFGLGRKFPLEMRFGLAGADVSVKVEADMDATLSLASNEYRLEDLNVKVAGSGAGWPGGQGDATLSFDSFVASLANETLELGGLTLKFLGITMAGSLSGQKLMSDLSLSGAVDIHEFDPRDVLDALKIELATADSGVLKSASAKANLIYTSKQLGLRDMQLKLDDSTLTGRFGLEGERLVYDLTVDDINIDRYLPPAEESSDAPADEGSLDAVDLPLDALRSMQARGELKFGKAKFSGLTLTDAVFGLTAANGTLRFTPSASLYGGKYGGQIEMAIQGDAARTTIKQQIDDVDLVPLGRDLLGSADVSGIGDVTLDLVATGTNLGAMRRGVDGDVSFSVTNGALEGFDMWFELRRARARLSGDEVPDRGDAPRRTPFSSLSATGTVMDALLTNRDLEGVLDFMTIAGTGTVNLLDNAISFDLKATMIDGPTLQSDPGMVKYAGKSLPLKATGTLDAPSVLPDFNAIVTERLQSEVDQRVEQEKSEAQQRLDEQKKEAQEKLQNRLRGLLNR